MNLTPEFADRCGTDKGTHQGFMPIYDRYLPDRWEAISLVELGVQKGASLHLWDSHFQNQFARIFGVDIDLSQLDPQYELSSRVRVIEGDQADCNPAVNIWMSDEFITRRTQGFDTRFDVIIDDASHLSSKTIGAFNTWWPFLKPGGLYVVEDTHCSYDREYYSYSESRKPELDQPGTSSFGYTTMGFLKRLADDVNWNIHGYDRFVPMHQDVSLVHFYPGIALIGKK